MALSLINTGFKRPGENSECLGTLKLRIWTIQAEWICRSGRGQSLVSRFGKFKAPPLKSQRLHRRINQSSDALKRRDLKHSIQVTKYKVPSTKFQVQRPKTASSFILHPL